MGDVDLLFIKYRENLGFDLQESGSNNMKHVIELYDEWLDTQLDFKPRILMDTFASSSSVKTFINIENKAMFSFAIFNFSDDERNGDIFFVNKRYSNTGFINLV